LNACIEDGQLSEKKGISVVVRKGSFMAKKDIFLKAGFVLADTFPPDFELLTLKFDNKAKEPQFKHFSAKKYEHGLTIMRSPQCPYSEKNVNAIVKTAEKMGISVSLIELNDAESAQQSPCAFGTFAIIYNGEMISHHPISNTRFQNIMKSKL